MIRFIIIIIPNKVSNTANRLYKFFLDIIIDCAGMYRELIDIKFEDVKLINTEAVPNELVLQIQEDMEELFLS